ncbi:MAG TPA: hypothetical protein VMB81_08235 [Candidatus Sulfotelmatobacter sp.]|nr:hypothetical protein [Candidatus Sulfotelmatobacter sp.]
MISEDLATFAQSLQSLWALDLLTLLHRDRARRWTVDALTRELRSTESLIREIITTLERRGLLARGADGSVRYQPSTAELDDLTGRLIQCCAERPLALVREIYSRPNENLRIFSDAFKLRKD